MPQNHVLLESIELSQTASSVTFDNIPQTGYSDLKIVVSARGTDSVYQTDCNIQVGNGTVDTGSNYQTREISGDGSSATFGSFTTTNVHPPMSGSTATSNTFGNFELYIPNYTSSTQKSMICDVVTENNATNAAARFCAYRYTGTSAINIITLTAASGTFVAGSTFRIYGVAALNTTPVTSPLALGGNIVANDGTYWYHAFLTSGTFTPQKNLYGCDYLVVAGGGGGGGQIGGGGGAGGLRYFSSQSFAQNTSYPAIIGAGGAGINGTGQETNSGTNSSFNSTSATGGGAGGSNGGTWGQGKNGGSSGGAGENNATFSGNAGGYTPVEGYGGGNASQSANYGSGGGGGAGGAGASGTTSAGGNGGVGINTYSTFATTTNTGVSGYYAGGGGGSIIQSSGNGSGGAGGGGRGGCFEDVVQPQSGTANTGGGGGGQASNSTSFLSGAGGSGIVIVRYPMAS
jgi:hypothetical protein